jgi:hypothetical protein
MKNLESFRNMTVFIFFVFLIEISYGQQWTEPVNISNLGGYSMDPDMVIDHKGVIHVVWSYQNSAYHWLILYTCSKDDGLTWSEPLDLLQNTDYWMLQPHIACDSKNNLYVAYTHDGSSWTPEGRLIKMLSYNGNQWSEPIIVSKELPGSHYNSVIIDYNDRVYFSWDHGPSGKNYFRYFESSNWSEIFCPYPNSAHYALTEADVDRKNNLHWIGSFGHYDIVLQYFLYDYPSNTWHPPEQPVTDSIQVGLDITLNNNEIPETVYRKVSNLPPGVGFEGTMHTKKEGNSWLAPDLVSGIEKRQVSQQIAIDQNNDVHVVEIEYYNSSDPDGQLVHYHYSKKNWIIQPIDSALHMINFPKMLFSGNNLYVVYYKGEVVVQGDIWISKYDIITNIKEEPKQTAGLTIYPNPSNDITYIEFENNQAQYTNISVFDVMGQHIITLANKTFQPGKQRLLWKGRDKNGKKVNSGLYLVRLKSGNKTLTQIVEILR